MFWPIIQPKYILLIKIHHQSHRGNYYPSHVPECEAVAQAATYNLQCNSLVQIFLSSYTNCQSMMCVLSFILNVSVTNTTAYASLVTEHILSWFYYYYIFLTLINEFFVIVKHVCK